MLQRCLWLNLLGELEDAVVLSWRTCCPPRVLCLELLIHAGRGRSRWSSRPVVDPGSAVPGITCPALSRSTCPSACPVLGRSGCQSVITRGLRMGGNLGVSLVIGRRRGPAGTRRRCRCSCHVYCTTSGGGAPLGRCLHPPVGVLVAVLCCLRLLGAVHGESCYRQPSMFFRVLSSSLLSS